MKKKLLYSISLLFFIFNVNGQIPVITSTSGLKANDVVYSFSANEAVQQGFPGGDNSWEFENQNYKYFDTITYHAKTNDTPNASEYTTANLVANSQFFTSDNSGFYQYSGSESYRDYNFGEWTNYDIMGPLTHSSIVVKFPFTYKDSWVSTRVFSKGIKLDQKSLYDSIRVYYNYKDSIVADAYGNLNTPLATYNNALRLTCYTTGTSRTDHMVKGNQGPDFVETWDIGTTDTINITSYTFWVPGLRGPVAKINSTYNTSTFFKTPGVAILGMAAQQSVSVFNDIYPNPAKDYFVVPSADKIISLADVAGAKVSFDSENFSDGSVKVNVGSVEPGLYQATVEYNGQSRIVRVAVTK